MINYYDREGKPISLEEWARLLGVDDGAYKRVASTDVGPYWVSTVWLGLDHGFMPDGPPVIFETMVFLSGERDDPTARGIHDMDCHRWCTEAEALAGHEEIVTLVRATLQE